MKIRRVMALALACTLLYSVPVAAANSPKASDTAKKEAATGGGSVEDAVAAAHGTTKAALDAMVASGEYESATDALYRGNITVPSDVSKDLSDDWQSVIAESNAMIDGEKVRITNDEKPKAIDKAVSGLANQHAKAGNKNLINKGSIKLKKFLEKHAGKSVTYPLLINKGQYTHQTGDTFLLYNYQTKTWDEQPATGFRKGHYDLSISAGKDMSAYFNTKGEVSYTIERAKK